MNIVLVGYRGTGKSTVARLVASELGFVPVSLDEEIVRRAGRSIPEIVKLQGWEAFRDLEEAACRDCAARDCHVLDCGGGVVERDANFSVLRQAGRVYWLTAKPKTIVERIADDDQRPSLTEGKSFTDEVQEVLSRRTPLYEGIAQVQIGTDHRSPAEIAEQIVRDYHAAQ